MPTKGTLQLVSSKDDSNLQMYRQGLLLYSRKDVKFIIWKVIISFYTKVVDKIFLFNQRGLRLFLIKQY